VGLHPIRLYIKFRTNESFVDKLMTTDSIGTGLLTNENFAFFEEKPRTKQKSKKV
jgi:hypothetical protein